MKKYDHLREKAIKLREKGMSLDDICERLCMKKGTVYYWIRDTKPLKWTKKRSKAAIAAGKISHKKYKKLREEAYQQGLELANELFFKPTFRDFIILYITEGYRKNRNAVAIANSNPVIVSIAYKWIKELKNKNRKILFRLQMHIDQDEEELKKYWAKLLKIKECDINTIRKSNSGNLSGRNWTSKYGLLTVRVGDTYLRAKLQAWMDIIEKEWKKIRV